MIIGKYIIIQILIYFFEISFFSIFSLYVEGTVYLLLLNIILKVLSFILAFFLHLFWTFKSNHNKKVYQATKYLILLVTNICLTNILLFLLLNLFDDYYVILKFLTDICFVIITFLFAKIYVFK